MNTRTHRLARMNRRRWVGIAVGLGVLWSGPAHAQPPPLIDASGQVREEAYDHLRRTLVGTGQPVTISARVETEMRAGLTNASVYGSLPGTTDETIDVMAHMDRYYDAALDNASGMAVMIGLAEHLAQTPLAERRRSITFIGTAGHHVGSPNASYLRDQGMLEKTALMINCEHIAPTQFVAFNTELRLTNTVTPRRWWVHGSQQLLDLTLDAYRTFGVSVIGEMDGRATGKMMAIDKAAPSVQLICSPEHKHTDGDIPGLVPAVGLEAVARAYAKLIDEVNTLDLAALQAAPMRSSR